MNVKKVFEYEKPNHFGGFYPWPTRHHVDCLIDGRKCAVVYDEVEDDRVVVTAWWSVELTPLPVDLLQEIQDQISYEDWKTHCKEKDDRDDYNAECAGLSRIGQPIPRAKERELKLTKTQEKAMDFIRQTIIDTHIPPTFREIAKHMGYSAVGSVQDLVKALKKKGYLQSFSGNKARYLVPSDMKEIK